MSVMKRIASKAKLMEHSDDSNSDSEKEENKHSKNKNFKNKKNKKTNKKNFKHMNLTNLTTTGKNSNKKNSNKKNSKNKNSVDRWPTELLGKIPSELLKYWNMTIKGFKQIEVSESDIEKLIKNPDYITPKSLPNKMKKKIDPAKFVLYNKPFTAEEMIVRKKKAIEFWKERERMEISCKDFKDIRKHQHPGGKIEKENMKPEAEEMVNPENEMVNPEIENQAQGRWPDGKKSKNPRNIHRREKEQSKRQKLNEILKNEVLV